MGLFYACIVSTDSLVVATVSDTVLSSKSVAHFDVSVDGSIIDKQAGNIKNCLSEWKSVTNDPSILYIVQDYRLEFLTQPVQSQEPQQTRFKENEIPYLHTEIVKLLSKGVVEPCDHEPNEFISPIFFVPKRMTFTELY